MGNSYGDFCGARPVKSPSAVFCRAGLVLTPQNVESSYQALAESNCIPRRWHVEGRWGIPIEQIKSGQHQGMRFIPLLYQAEQRLPKEVLALLDAGTACLIPQNSSNASKAGAWTDWHPGHKTAICQQTSAIAPPAFVFIIFFIFCPFLSLLYLFLSDLAFLPPHISLQSAMCFFFFENTKKTTHPLLFFSHGKVRMPSPSSLGTASFTFAELFAGIGGFRLGLESLGGRCVFASEIEPFTREVYILNFGEVPPIAGDIRKVKDEEIPLVDLLVAGFPCQPFSALGTQPAFEDDRGLLFHEIVRVLKASKAKSFLLENVPGLLDCDDGRALQAIKRELIQSGYEVQIRTANARNLTAQSRKRVFFFGVREDLATLGDDFALPFIPELHLRARDFLQTEEELSDEADIYALSEEHFNSLKESKKWSRRGGMTDTLVWEEKLCNTLVSHYGTSLGKGNSQLVPRTAPLNPRRFTPRECARLMGFPDTFRLTDRPEDHPSVWFLELGYSRSLHTSFGSYV